MNHWRPIPPTRRRHTAQPPKHVQIRVRGLRPLVAFPAHACPHCGGALLAHSATGCGAQHRRGFACPCRPILPTMPRRDREPATHVSGPTAPSTLLDRLDAREVNRLRELRRGLVLAGLTAGEPDRGRFVAAVVEFREMLRAAG